MRNKILKGLEDKEFLSKLYGYSYKRCSTSHEAEDLCSEIILALLKSCSNCSDIKNFYAYAWTVAHRVYADFCKKRKIASKQVSDSSYNYELTDNPIQTWHESIEDGEDFKEILNEISFLARIYRQVMVMYYLDEIKIPAIAKSLGISENSVKQRLFTARKKIQTSIISERTENMNKNSPAIRPMRFIKKIGTGNPCGGNDPREQYERLFSQSLIYLCKDKERTATELAEIMNVPAIFIEEELEIQANSGNGYGALKKLENGKYINNIMIIDYTDHLTINDVLKQHFNNFAEKTVEYFKKNNDIILNFPHFASEQKNIETIIWVLIHERYYGYMHRIEQCLKNEHFYNQKIAERVFTCYVIASGSDENTNSGFFGCDGTNARDICGYEHIFIKNLYDNNRIKKHFGAGWNIYSDEKLKMLIKSIKGINVGELNGDEAEIAAKAIEEGYIRKENDKLVPNIIAVPEEYQNSFFDLGCMDIKEWESLVQEFASDMAKIIKTYLSKHLMCDYLKFAQFCSDSGYAYLIESCVKKGIISFPEKTPGVQGVFMTYK